MEIKLPFGIKEGKLIHISELNPNENGLKCNCYCPRCNSPLTARMGSVRVHHFAHQSEKCNNALETALHLFAKETLERYKRIKLPELILYYYNDISYPGFTFKAPDRYMYYADTDEFEDYNYEKVKICNETYLNFDRIENEKRIDTIIPDIIVYKSGRPLSLS